MAGPLDLRGRVIIRDGGALNTLGQVERRLRTIGTLQQRSQNAVATGARNVQRTTTAAIGSAAGAYGAMRVLRGAEDFNRSVFGAGAAAVSDYTSAVESASTGTRRVVVDLEKVRGVMQKVDGISRKLAREINQSPTRLAGMGEVLAKAGFSDDKLEAAMRALAQVSVTDLETPVGRMAEFADVLNTIYKPQAGETWARFFTRQMDIVRVAAGETRLSVGSMMEGLRPFSALYAQLGMSETDNALMLMAGVKAGGEATEIGHTLKSNSVRFMNMTTPAMAAFDALGLRRSDYADTSAMDPSKATGYLNRLFPEAGIRGGYRTELMARLQQAQKDGSYDDPAFFSGLSREIAGRAGIDMSNMESRQAFEERFANAIFGAGMNVDMLKLYRDLIEKGASPAQWGQIFEGRRIGYNMQIRQGLTEFGMNDSAEFPTKLGLATGVGLEATQTIYDESQFGKLQKFYARIDEFQIKLAESKGFERFLTGITQIVDALGSLPQPMVDIITTAGMVAIALGPIALGMAALGVVLGPLRWLAKLGAGLFGGAKAAGGLFSMGKGVVGGAAAAAASARMITGMGGVAAASASSRMIQGMSGAGAAAAAASAGKGGSWLGRLAGLGAKGLGRLFLPLSVGLLAWDAWDGYQKTGTLTGAALNTLTMGLYAGEAEGAEAPPEVAAGPGVVDPVPTEATAAAEQIRQIFASLNLEAEGRQAMETFAAGIRAGGASAISAARTVASGVKSAASGRVPLNTGPAMGAEPVSP